MTRVVTQRIARMQQLSSENTQERNFRTLDRFLARTFVRELLRHRARQMPDTGGVLRPRMDLCDDPASVHIIAILELPGLKQEDLSVRIEDENLIIQGERPFRPLARRPSRSLDTSPRASHRPVSRAGQAPVASSSALVRPRSAEPSCRVPGSDARPELPHGYTTQEIKYGAFQRTIALPPGTQVGHVRASLAEGMLTLSWPRNPYTVSPVPAEGGAREGHGAGEHDG